MKQCLVPCFLLAGVMLFAPVVPADPNAEELVKLSQEYWEEQLRNDPLNATSLGDHRYDHLLDDNTPEGIAARADRLRNLQSRVRALNPEDLSRADRITLNALRFHIRSQLARIECGLETWTVSAMGGPQVSFFNIPSYHKITTVRSGRGFAKRCQAMGPYIDRHIDNLGRGLAQGKVATRDAVERVVAQINDLELTPVDDWSLIKHANTVPKGEDWIENERKRVAADIRDAVRGSLRPALLRYRDFLHTEVLPRTRGQDKPGIMHVDGGKACYEKMILVHTSLEISAEEIHHIGLEEVKRINQEMRELGERVLGTADLEEIHKRLRTDSEMHFTTRDEVEEKAKEALNRARAKMPEYFGLLPQAPCAVVRMEAHEEKHSTIAYYRRPAADGSRPGSYYINTYAPETRPRYEAEALAFHEAIPGHHLQIAIMQEMEDLPAFRKHSGVTAYIEGWGLYTERLSNEMGLYSGDTDRLGMLSYDSWRACRLVVDTGMHALGWTRREAVDFMLANTVLAENNIVNEVDRYIVWPGQALAYKLGQREIFRLRADAKARLGDRFELKGFHDTVLGEGAVDLATLSAIVDEWVESTLAK